MTTLSCVRVSHIRPTWHDLKDWCSDERNVYIGRRGAVFIDGQRYPLRSSIWANPYKEGTKEEMVANYKVYITHRLDDPLDKEVTWEELEKLRGKNLGCYCEESPCHGDALLELLRKHK